MPTKCCVLNDEMNFVHKVNLTKWEEQWDLLWMLTLNIEIKVLFTKVAFGYWIIDKSDTINSEKNEDLRKGRRVLRWSSRIENECFDVSHNEFVLYFFYKSQIVIQDAVLFQITCYFSSIMFLINSLQSITKLEYVKQKMWCFLVISLAI